MSGLGDPGMTFELEREQNTEGNRIREVLKIFLCFHISTYQQDLWFSARNIFLKPFDKCFRVYKYEAVELYF